MSKILRVNPLVETKYLSMYEAEYQNKNNKNKTWMIASRKNKDEIEDIYFNNKEDSIDAVVIIPIHKEENKIVLIRQFRVPINSYVIELPAGLVDGNEGYEEAVRRELKEETGLDLLYIDKEASIEKSYISPGMTDESVALIKCYCTGKASIENLEEDEDLEVILLDKEEAKRIIMSKEKIDIKAFMALQSFIINE